MNICLNCGIDTNNPKFCSKSCAAVYNNKKFPKRTKKKYFCVTCGIEVINRRKYCLKHNPQNVNWSKITIKDVTDTLGKNANRYRSIRNNSRNIYLKSNKPKYCVSCGYDKHFDVCHIKDIKSFSKETPVSIVNALDNLLALCPNCHWEAHNGL